MSARLHVRVTCSFLFNRTYDPYMLREGGGYGHARTLLSMFPVGQFVKHKDGRRGVVVNRDAEGKKYTVSWLLGHGIEHSVSMGLLQASAPYGRSKRG